MNPQAQTLSPSSSGASSKANSGLLYALQYKHATVLTAITFMIVGVTGVMVFFHLGTSYVMGLHEWLGLAMVVAAVLHMTRHFKGLVKQLQKPRARVWLLAGALAAALFVGNAFMAPSGGNPMKGFAQQSLRAPVSAVGAVLKLSDDELQARLDGAGFKDVALTMSVKEIAASNNTDDTRVLAVVMGR